VTLDALIERLKRHLESLVRHQETGSVTIHIHKGDFSEKLTESRTTHLN
jgi:hypothetical protein